MKKYFLAVLTALFTLSVYAKDIQEVVFTTNPPMSCQNCENKIKSNLRFEKGVKKIETNIPDQRVTVEYDAEKTNPAQIESAFEKFGYQARIISPEECDEKGAEPCTVTPCQNTKAEGASCCGKNCNQQD